jgi:hypothetical protein
VRVTLESTTKVVQLDGVPGRIWEGTTDSGIAVHAIITRVAVHHDADTRQFEAELTEHRAPRNADIVAYPHRLIL